MTTREPCRPQEAAFRPRDHLRTHLRIALAIVLICVCVRAQPENLKIGSATSHVVVPNAPELMPHFALTVEAWVRFSPSQPWGITFPTIIRVGDDISSPFHFYINDNSGRLHLRIQTPVGVTVHTSSIAVPAFTWAHVAGTWDGSQVTLYINGAPVGTYTQTHFLLDSTEDFYIGGSPINTNVTWKGRIDELRLWNYARSGSEIVSTITDQLDHNPGLVACWHFNGDLEDKTGGHHGTAVDQATLEPSTSPVDPLQLVVPGRVEIGTSIVFGLDGCPPNSPYFLDNSFAGASTGTPLIAPLVGNFPLDSPLLNLTYGPLAPGIFENYMGLTDSAGQATATFHVPAYSHLLGLDMKSAFLYLQSLSPMVLGEISPVVTSTFQEAVPTLSSVLPPTGPITGWPIVISGQNFNSVPTVYVGDQLATQVTLLSSGIVTCNTPTSFDDSPQTVRVLFPGFDPLHAPGACTYLGDLVITSMTPQSAAPGTSVTLQVDEALPGATVVVGGVPAIITQFNYQTFGSTIVFTMPAGTSCHAAVVVTNPDGRSDSLVINPGPFITSIASAQGPAAGGSVFTIVGGNFDAGTQVTVGGTLATVTSSSFSTLTVIAPPGIVGSASVVVTNTDGCSASGSYLYQ